MINNSSDIYAVNPEFLHVNDFRWWWNAIFACLSGSLHVYSCVGLHVRTNTYSTLSSVKQYIYLHMYIAFWLIFDETSEHTNTQVLAIIFRIYECFLLRTFVPEMYLFLDHMLIRIYIFCPGETFFSRGFQNCPFHKYMIS